MTAPTTARADRQQPLRDRIGELETSLAAAEARLRDEQEAHAKASRELARLRGEVATAERRVSAAGERARTAAGERDELLGALATRRTQLDMAESVRAARA